MNKRELEYMKHVIDEMNSDDPNLMVDSILGEMYYWFKKQYKEQTKKISYDTERKTIIVK